jgi:transcriptional regulator with XRE-family HTH domain
MDSPVRNQTMSFEDFSAVHFGQVLKKLRVEKQISQERLAGRCSLNRSYISLLERNRKNPRIDTFFALAIGLGVKASDILKEVEELEENDWLMELFKTLNQNEETCDDFIIRS